MVSKPGEFSTVEKGQTHIGVGDPSPPGSSSDDDDDAPPRDDPHGRQDDEAGPSHRPMDWDLYDQKWVQLDRVEKEQQRQLKIIEALSKDVEGLKVNV